MESDQGDRFDSGGGDDDDEEDFDEDPMDMANLGAGVRFSDAQTRLDARYSGCTSNERTSNFRQRLLSVSKASTSTRRISLMEPRRMSLMETGMLTQMNVRKNSSSTSTTNNSKPLSPKAETTLASENKIRNSFVDEGSMPPLPVVNEKRLSILSVKEFKELRGIRRSSKDAELKRPTRKDIWKNSTNVKFDSSVPAPGFSSLPGRHVDELAVERSTEGYWKHRLAEKRNAILHHRNSMTGGSRHAEPPVAQKGQNDQSNQIRGQHAAEGSANAIPKNNNGSPPRKQVICPFISALQRLPAFKGCSNSFLSLLAGSGEQIKLKVGEVRDMDGSRVAVARTRPAMAIVVVSGSFRIEIAGILVDECSAGSSFGLANMFSRVNASGGRTDTQGALMDFVVRASHSSPEGCRLLAIHSTALKFALASFPEDSARLHDLLRLSSQQLVNSAQQIVSLLHCSESAKPAIMDSTTRHTYVAGETICCEGMRSPDGVVVIRSGTVTLEINGIKIRQLSKGQGIGEEILFGVCRKWGVTARCTSLCDVQILHRRLFTHWVKEMQHSTAEEKRESDRLLIFLEGRWKEDRVILAWPLFRGYDQDLLAKLAHLIETRILLPGNKLWECGGTSQQAAEVALYVLLCGSCEENSTTERQARPGQSETQNSKRSLVPGACIGTREFLGLPSSSHMVVIARSLSIVAVLHRDVFISAIDSHIVDVPQAAEITHLLKDSLDQNPNAFSAKKGDRGCECLVGGLPMLKGAERRLVEKICNTACKRRFCIAGQSLCRAGARAATMFVFIRGWANLTVADTHIKRIAYGEVVNVLALAKEAFTPAYNVKCEQTSEVWALSRDDFASCLDAFPQEKGKFSDLLHAPSALFMQKQLSTLPAFDGNASPRSTNPSPLRHDSTGTIATMSLTEVKMFEQCTPVFLEWIEAHLHAMIFFTDEIIVREGQEDTGLYIIRSGTVIGEGEGTPQVRLESGRTIGEDQILGISAVSVASYQVIDVAVVQVLHQSVWRKGLELFPDQVPLFDRLILSRMPGVVQFELQHCPFFSGSNKDFCRQVERLMRTSLVRPGTVVLEDGCEEKVIRIIKSGVAVVHEDIVDDATYSEKLPNLARSSSKNVAPQKRKEPIKHTYGSTLNIDVAVGATRCSTTKVMAETLLAVGEIDGFAFLGVLQRFPNEIVPLMRAVVSGRLWPLEADSVPLFRGVSPRFFESLMSTSSWRMFLPDQCVVKQGGKGDLLFLLCYGVAVTEIDDIVVGSSLVRGDCVGKLNFLGLVSRYAETVRTRMVCHFRSMAGATLAELLEQHLAERDRFRNLKAQVQVEVAQNEVLLKEQATREKLRRREQHAFRGHIAKERECRGVAPIASSSSLASLVDLREMPEDLLMNASPRTPGTEEQTDAGNGNGEASPQEKPPVEIVATDKDDMQLNLMRKSIKLKPGIAPLGSADNTNKSSNEVRSSFVHRMRGKSIRRMSKLVGATKGDSRESLQSGSRGSGEPGSSETLSDSTLGANSRKCASKSRTKPKKGLSFNENIEGKSPTSSFGGSDDDEEEDKPSISARLTVAAKKSIFASPSDSDDDEINQQLFFNKMKDFTQSRSMSKRELMDIEISEHAEAREKALLRGRMLRMFHADLRPNSCVRANLSQEDLHELTFHLPKLPPESVNSSTSDFFAGQPSVASGNASIRKQERAAKASPGRSPMRFMSKAAEQILRRKYRQLASQFGAVVPTAN